MARIEGFRVRNYGPLHDVSLGRLYQKPASVGALTPLVAVIGKNGAGKSTLFDAFGFLADCLRVGVEDACDSRERGGFQRLRSQGMTDPIVFELYYREGPQARPITYELQIDLDESGRPYVAKERLLQRRKNQKSGRPLTFLYLQKGRGVAWKGETEGKDITTGQMSFLDVDDLMREESNAKENVELDDARKLGIATLGSLKQHPRISMFRKFIEGWYLSYFTPDAARGLPMAGAQKHLNIHGDNLGNVVQFMEREHPREFRRVLGEIARKIPGVDKISTEPTPDGRLLLKFNDKGFRDPFYAQKMSDGTLKVFAYLLLLNDPTPAPFLCIEEPENGIYHKLLETLVGEFREHAGHKGGSQVFVTTHQPYFVDALTPDEVWILEKGPNGFSSIKRASDIPLVKNLAAEGIPLGGLWYSDYLDRG